MIIPAYLIQLVNTCSRFLEITSFSSTNENEKGEKLRRRAGSTFEIFAEFEPFTKFVQSAQQIVFSTKAGVHSADTGAKRRWTASILCSRATQSAQNFIREAYCNIRK